MKNQNDLKQYSWWTAKFYSLIMIFYNNNFVIDYFMQKVDKSKEILEIGSATGREFGILSKQYNITGSDYSNAFLKSLRRKFKSSEFLKLNALTMEVENQFDVIYSNKVLQHLTPEQLKISLLAQYKVLRKGGILFHAVWKGNSQSGEYKGIPDVQYQLEDFERFKGDFLIEEYIEYKEMKDNDSFIIILRKE